MDEKIPDVLEDPWSSIWCRNEDDIDRQVVKAFRRYQSQSLEEASLRTKIMRARVESAVDLRKFVPADSLRALLTEEAIKHELSLIGKRSEELSHYIVSEASKVFAILVYIDMASFIEEFYQKGISDTLLPMDFKGLNNDDSIALSVGSVQQSKAFTSWKYVQISSFSDSQWIFLAPIFTDDQFVHGLHDYCALPFTWVNRETPKTSLFSTVHEAIIHPGHLRVNSPVS